MRTIKCEMCSKEFFGRDDRKTCSEECRLARSRKRFGSAFDKSIPCGTVGAMSELAISVDLLKKGYSVFRALSPACFCDVIAIKDNNTLKIEIRTGYMNYQNKLMYPKIVKGNVDIFGVYERTKSECFYFDLENKPYKV